MYYTEHNEPFNINSNLNYIQSWMKQLHSNNEILPQSNVVKYFNKRIHFNKRLNHQIEWDLNISSILDKIICTKHIVLKPYST